MLHVLGAASRVAAPSTCNSQKWVCIEGGCKVKSPPKCNVTEVLQSGFSRQRGLELLEHQYLSSFCRILGENNSNLPKIAQVIAVVLSKGSSLADTETVTKMKALLAQLQPSLPEPVRSLS